MCIRDSLKWLRKKDSTVTRQQVEDRGKWLEEKFTTEVIATYEIAQRDGSSPLDLKGSPSGALGIAQFLPSNIDKLGMDGSGDGEVDLFEPADAIFSVGNYLFHHGWDSETHKSQSKMKEVIWSYNHSDAYVNTVLGLATRLKKKLMKNNTS